MKQKKDTSAKILKQKMDTLLTQKSILIELSPKTKKNGKSENTDKPNTSERDWEAKYTILLQK